MRAGQLHLKLASPVCVVRQAHHEGELCVAMITTNISDFGSLQSTQFPHGEPVEPRTLAMQAGLANQMRLLQGRR